VSQKPCIISGTIRDNIIFGQPPNQQRYDKAINAAELVHDLENMPNKDLTEVAERGSTLSGGQKARLSLARSFFSNRDIYLIDDVLSSTNKEVADNIFKKSVKDLLVNKTVVMITSKPEVINIVFYLKF
jgi:ABC-type multidrug transport system fused ATPase/permease subunit